MSTRLKELADTLDGVRRTPLLVGPTPLHFAPRLSDALDVPVWFKRDDLTGVGLGGNKIRTLEYLVADALDHGHDCLVTGAGGRSNWAMLAALVARRCGLEPHLVYFGSPPAVTGNQMLARMINANIEFTGSPDRTSVDVGIRRTAERLAALGRRPYTIPRGGATAIGAMGYVAASLELEQQFTAADIKPRSVWLASGSGGTQAGLLAGTQALAAPHRVVGVTVSRTQVECADQVMRLADEAADLLAIPGWSSTSAQAETVVVEGYRGQGYGIESPEGRRAAELVARTEGVFLDPVYGAKAMAALIETARRGEIDGPAVFLVTGGLPALFDRS